MVSVAQIDDFVNESFGLLIKTDQNGVITGKEKETEIEVFADAEQR